MRAHEDGRADDIHVAAEQEVRLLMIAERDQVELGLMPDEAVVRFRVGDVPLLAVFGTDCRVPHPKSLLLRIEPDGAVQRAIQAFPRRVGADDRIGGRLCGREHPPGDVLRPGDGLIVQKQFQTGKRAEFGAGGLLRRVVGQAATGPDQNHQPRAGAVLDEGPSSNHEIPALAMFDANHPDQGACPGAKLVRTFAQLLIRFEDFTQRLLRLADLGGGGPPVDGQAAIGRAAETG